MSKVQFTHDGETWWFDPESGDYEYDGSNTLVKTFLSNLSAYTTVQTGNLQGIGEHPGEMWDTLSPEDRKEKALNYLSRVDGLEIHE